MDNNPSSNSVIDDQTPSHTAPNASSSLRAVLTAEPSGASSLLGQSSNRFSKLPVGSQIEVSPDAYRIARKVGELLQSGRDIDGKPSVGGCGLIVDYGGISPSEDSLRVGEILKLHVDF